jgi:hypothetical protein
MNNPSYAKKNSTFARHRVFQGPMSPVDIRVAIAMIPSLGAV